MTTNHKASLQSSIREPENHYNIEEQFQILEDFKKEILDNIKDLDPEISKTIDKYYWDLI